MSKNVKWDITYKCNLNCAHCINGDLLHHIENELTLEEAKNIIKKIKMSGIDYVHLLGGEPTAREDILEIFSEFEYQNLGFGFNTNGLKLTNEEFRTKVIENKALKNIVFSLEGPTAEINDKIRGKRVFSVTTKNLKEIITLKKELSREDVIITVNLVVSKLNLHYIMDMVFFCIAMKVNELVLLQFIPEGNGKANDQSISPEQTLWLIGEIAEKYSEIKDKIKITPKFAWPLARKYAKVVLKKEFPKTASMCGAGNTFFYVNNKGELFPCDRYKKQILELNKGDEINLTDNEFWDVAAKDGFGDIYEKTESNQYYPLMKPCNECEYLRESCYPCIGTYKQPEQAENNLCKKMMEEIKCVSVE